MKKLYRKGSVHPSPPNKLDQLNFLPAAILTLATALSPEEKEVLAYLISCSNSSGNSFSDHHQHHRRGSSSSSSFARSNTTGTGSGDHPTSFKCDCFRCYMSYWARWDSSPNRQLIHEIIEAFEDWLVQSSNQSSKKSRRERKKKGIDSNNNSSNSSTELKQSETHQKNELGESDSVIESSSSGAGDGGDGSSGGGEEGEEEGKGSVRRLMNFIGERIWGVWGSSI